MQAAGECGGEGFVSGKWPARRGRGAKVVIGLCRLAIGGSKWGVDGVAGGDRGGDDWQ